MNMGEFIKFTKDFSINLPKTVVSSVFKRTALYSREMHFDHFRAALVQCMKEFNRIKIESLKAEFKDIKQALTTITNQMEEQRKRE